jgi:hypothetical protein
MPFGRSRRVAPFPGTGQHVNMTTVSLVRESRVSALLLRFLERELCGLPPMAATDVVAAV